MQGIDSRAFALKVLSLVTYIATERFEKSDYGGEISLDQLLRTRVKSVEYRGVLIRLFLAIQSPPWRLESSPTYIESAQQRSPPGPVVLE